MNALRLKRGFTLVEIMIVVALIGLLASIAVPTMLNASRTSRSKAIAKEIQTAGDAFIQYSFDHAGEYPADKTPAQMPSGMAPYLSKFPWTEETIVGGNWDWDYNVFGVTAAVSVKSPTWDDDLMTLVDEVLDDGDLGSGMFRTRGGGYMYVLEE
ncbi:MAG: type II secretion system GspH family protein [Pontiella sp.]|nr:type II secretion system GspH family protein [Pontiella sp.]MBT8045703.1 type II secretion system GspH family protein [Pontiella sp.]NNJ70902.1 type II secretion system protein [Kiritimatiellales bacterium]